MPPKKGERYVAADPDAWTDDWWEPPDNWLPGEVLPAYHADDGRFLGTVELVEQPDGAYEMRWVAKATDWIADP